MQNDNTASTSSAFQALVNLSGDHITFDVGSKKNQKVKIVGTHEDPWFCGKDVCEILEYKDIKQALLVNVRPKHKKHLKILSEEIVATAETPTVLGSTNFENINHNQGRAVYINEAGLYSLILKSKAPFAGDFQDFVCEEILPSIRKHGQYKIEQKYKDQITKQRRLTIEAEQRAEEERQRAEEERQKAEEERLAKEEAEQKAEEERLAKEEAEQKAEEERLAKEEAEQKAEEERLAKEEAEQLVETTTQELQKQELYTNKLKDMVVSIKNRQKEQIIYIATTNAYARQNRFKVGGVKSRAHLKSRLSTYNSGRPQGDKMYYAFFTETVDYHHLEQRISRILGDHKDAAEAEVYNVHFDSLQPLVEYLADRFDEEIKHHQNLFEQLLKDTIEKPPTIPVPLIVNGAECRMYKDGKLVCVQTIDFDVLEEEARKSYVKSRFEEFLVFAPKELTRKAFEDYLIECGAKFNKVLLWRYTKSTAIEMKKSIKY